MSRQVFILLFAAASLSIACATVSHGITGKTVSQSLAGSCPAGSETARAMVKNFLTNPRGAEARQETGTTGISANQIQLVEDQSTCEQLSENYSSSEYADYKVTYYKAGNNYFATIILKQPDDPNTVVTGLSFIDIYDESLNFIKGYGG